MISQHRLIFTPHMSISFFALPSALLFLLSLPGGELKAQRAPIPYHKGSQWGYSDSSGRIIIQPKYDSAGQFFIGRAWVKKDGLFWYIDTRGKRPFRKKFSAVSDFEYGIARVVSENLKDTLLINIHGKTGFVSVSSRDVFVNDYFDIRKIAVGDPAEFNKTKEFYGKISGDSVRIFRYEKFRGFYADDRQPVEHAFVTIEGRAGVINEQGVFILQPIYDAVFPREDLHLKVMKDGKWAYFDKTGKQITPFEFDELGSFWQETNGRTEVLDCAIAKKDGKFGLIGADGKLRTAIKFDKILPFKDGIALSIQNGKGAYLNQQGKEFSNNLALKK